MNDGLLEVGTQVGLIVRVAEVVDPARRVGIDVDNIGIEEVPRSGERTVDGLAVDHALVIDIGRVLADHHHLVGIDRNVGVEVALLRVETIAAQGCCRVVVDLVAVVELARVEHLLSRGRIGDVEALEGSQLVLRRLARQTLVPVEMRSDGVAVLILGDHVALVATVGRVCQSGTENRVAHPVDKLLILRVGHLCLVHPEAINTNVLHGH